MRLSVLPILLTGVSVASLVAAEPIRAIESLSNAKANLRFGHALANANVNGNDEDVPHIVRHAVIVKITPQDNDKGLFRHFCGTSLREKALRLSNAFRHALGMPLIEADLAVPRPGEVHILPVLHPSSNVILHPEEELDGQGKPGKHHGDERHHHLDDGEEHEHHPHHAHHAHHTHHGHHGHHGHHEHRRKYLKCFLKRIHKAIKALGPWEGRAVAFVLGCGIGVLLRLFWVLSVLTYRAVCGERGEETLDREYILYEQVPETLFVTPPQYDDEKVKVEANEDVGERK